MDPFLGEIKIFAGTYAPQNWAFCEGQIINIIGNESLFSILGTTYGGDGRITFGLPDLRGRVAVGVGKGPGLSTYVLGQRTGAEEVMLNSSNVPAHSHALNAYSGAGDSSDPTGNVLANTVGLDREYSTMQPNVQMSLSAIGDTRNSQQGVKIVQPLTALHYIICIQGTYPPRH